MIFFLPFQIGSQYVSTLKLYLYAISNYSFGKYAVLELSIHVSWFGDKQVTLKRTFMYNKGKQVAIEQSYLIATWYCRARKTILKVNV